MDYVYIVQTLDKELIGVYKSMEDFYIAHWRDRDLNDLVLLVWDFNLCELSEPSNGFIDTLLEERKKRQKYLCEVCRSSMVKIDHVYADNALYLTLCYCQECGYKFVLSENE